jgi:hypothetical protein
MSDIPTNEEISRHFKAMLDSVTLIHELTPAQDNGTREIIDRNVHHLIYMLNNKWWDGYDLTLVNEAITLGKQ